MIWVLIITVIIVVPCVIIANNKRNELIAEGKIANRDIDFVKKAEIFTIRKLDNFSPVTDGVMALDYSDIKCELNGDRATQKYHFKGADWTANLSLVENDDSHMVYRFSFGQWSERNGIPYSAIPMNKLETAIEKLFLNIDGSATVRSELVEYNTKHSFL